MNLNEKQIKKVETMLSDSHPENGENCIGFLCDNDKDKIIDLAEKMGYKWIDGCLPKQYNDDEAKAIFFYVEEKKIAQTLFERTVVKFKHYGFRFYSYKEAMDLINIELNSRPDISIFKSDMYIITSDGNRYIYFESFCGFFNEDGEMEMNLTDFSSTLESKRHYDKDIVKIYDKYNNLLWEHKLGKTEDELEIEELEETIRILEENLRQKKEKLNGKYF